MIPVESNQVLGINKKDFQFQVCSWKCNYLQDNLLGICKATMQTPSLPKTFYAFKSTSKYQAPIEAEWFSTIINDYASYIASKIPKQLWF